MVRWGRCWPHSTFSTDCRNGPASWSPEPQGRAPATSGEPTPDEHFDHAWHRRQDRAPLEEEPMLDADLRFAAACRARWRGQMIDLRQQAAGALRELKQRWQGVTATLRERQPAAIRRVTAQRDVGFTALLIILSSWPDVSYPYGLVCGLPAVGYAPPYGIFPEQEARRIPFEEVVMGAEANNQRILATLRAGKDDVFLLSQSTLDAERGFCTYPMRRRELLQAVKGAPFRLIPRCVITQSSGKQRIIDNADQGGQSELSSDANKLVLCTPLRPAQHIRAVVAQMAPDDLREAAAADSCESGDWPDAYRHSPMSGTGVLGLRGGLLAPFVGRTSLPALCGSPVWAAPGGHQFQPVFQVGGVPWAQAGLCAGVNVF